MFMRILVAACTVVALSTSASGRIFQFWSYDKLNKRADVIVVATPISAEKFEDVSDPPQMGDVVFEGQLTKFKIHGVMKGEIAEREMQLVHYRVVANGRTEPNGIKIITSEAHVAKFSMINGSGKGKESADPPQYLLFLKQRKDGKFEPVSGQIDSACSVMLLTPQGPAHWQRDD